MSSFLAKFRQQRLALQSLLASIPFMIYFRDEYYSVTRIRGTSMEPNIQNGDIILIRKRDAGNLLLYILNLTGFTDVSTFDKKDEGDKVDQSTTPSNNYNATTMDKILHNNKNNDREHAMWYRIDDDMNSFLLVSPSHMSPLILPGHVIVYRNPYIYHEYLIKRVIGVGGQRISTGKIQESATIVNIENVYNSNTDNIHDNNHHPSVYNLYHHLIHKQQLELYYDLRLPPHFIYTEGDNATSSQQDCRDMGNVPISQNLVVGIAEYILWPPSRWGRIHRQPVHGMSYKSPRPRAIWDR
jgi:signal peptidase I